MPVVSELIRSESDKTLSFGDYTLDDKKKVEDFKIKSSDYVQQVKYYFNKKRLEEQFF